jgi:hypothetical protein
MPKINRVRIGGLKYNGMQKRYHDLTFDLHNDSEATNALISLMNGGGKSVLFQTIFQILKPGTSWGDSNNKLYQHFFYNNKDQFSAYSFHVAIEWELDTEIPSYLVTGGIFSANRIVTGEGDGEEKIKPDYHFYSKEYAKDEKSDISALPLFENGNAKNYGELKRFLEENGYDCYKNDKRHLSMMESYGIHEKSWDIVKDINKDEGGVEKFFEKSLDDQSLFRNKIIPTISQWLRQKDAKEDDLAAIFKSQASIAKDLPILIQREEAHREFLEEIIPFEEQVQRARDQVDKVNENKQEGQRLLSAFDHIIALEKRLLDGYDKEVVDLKVKKLRLLFERDNLNFAKINKEIIRLQVEVGDRKQHFEQQAQELRQHIQSEQQLLLAILHKEWDHLDQAVSRLRGEIKTLENNADIQELILKMDEVRGSCQTVWNDTKVQLQQEVVCYAGWIKHSEAERHTFDCQKDKIIHEKAEVSSRLKHLYDFIQQHEYEKQTLMDRFGKEVGYNLEAVIMTTNENWLEHLRKIEACSSQQKEYVNQRIEVSMQRASQLEKQNNTASQIDKLQENLEIQLKKEERIRYEIAQVLKEEVDILSFSLLGEMKAKTETAIKDSQLQLEEGNRKLWQIQLDKSLNDETFWVANSDLKRLKTLLSATLDVFYGTEFLQNLREQDRERYLQDYPLLPFGLVVYDQQWKKLNKTSFNDDVFQSAIPIFIREKMKASDLVSYDVVGGQAADFSRNETLLLQWKNKMIADHADKHELIHELKATLHTFQKLKQDLESLLQNPLSSSLHKEIEEKQAAIRRIQAEVQRLVQQEEAINDKEKLILELMEQSKLEVERAKAKLSELKVLKENGIKNELHVHEKSLKEKQNEELAQQLKKIDQEIKEAAESQKQWEHVYMHWENNAQRDLKEIRVLISDAYFPKNEPSSESMEPPVLSDSLFSLLMQYVREHNLLQATKEQQNQALLGLNIRLQTEEEKRELKEGDLAALSDQWRSHPQSVEPIQVMNNRRKTLLEEIKERETTQRQLEMEIGKIDERLKIKTEDRLNIHRKIEREHQKLVEPWEDINLEEKESEINHNLETVLESLETCWRYVENTNNLIRSYENHEHRIQDYLGENPLPFLENELEDVRRDGYKKVTEWVRIYITLRDEKEKVHRRIEFELQKLKNAISDKKWEYNFKNDLLASLSQIHVQYYEHVFELISGMKNFSRNGLEQLDIDKARAIKAQGYWSSRAARKVIAISDTIRTMVGRMKIKNEKGYFPLVDLREDALPKKAEDIEHLLKNHFIDAIEKITKKFATIDDQNTELDKEIEKLVGDAEIFLVALHHQYPAFYVYNMQTNNAFMYGHPRRENYSTWKTINGGSQTTADGSGGQKLAARMIVMMMLLSAKNESDRSWMSLLCDNPFGQAASSHVLDPIFIVAEKLKFQLIVVTPPELVMTDISRRFPVYYKLDFKLERGREVISETVQQSFRIYEEPKPPEV